MQLEWLFFVLLLIWASILILKRVAGLKTSAWLFFGALGLSTLASAKLWNSHLTSRLADQKEVATILPREGRPDGYVSSTKCQACHPGEYASWHQTFHRTMTQFASSESVKGSFDNVDLTLDGETFHLYCNGDEFYVDMVDPVWKENQLIARKANPAALTATQNLAAGPRAQMRVGLLTGSHTMQAYWLSTKRGNMQMIFPFAWLIEDKRWAPFHETFLRDPAVPPATAVWNYVCIRCHATGGQPRQDTQAGNYDSRTGELGIACEACHGPAEKHIALNNLPQRRYALHRAAKGDASIVNPKRLATKRASEVCGDCHGIKWVPNVTEMAQIGFRFRPGAELSQTTPMIQPSRLEVQPWLHNWLGENPSFLPDRYWSDGEVRVSGREFNGLIDSPCYQRGELSCLSCHSMHQSNPKDQLAARMDGNSACVQCHTKFAANIAEHTHHTANSSGSECYNCHMPHTTYGLLKNIRSHRITSPDVAATIKTGRPNACNLCHLDRTLEWTADQLSRWYRQPKPSLNEEQRKVSAAVALTLKGDAGQRALMAWHMGWEPARKISGEDWLAPYLAQLMDDPYSAVRYIAGRSIRAIPEFKGLEFDFSAAANSGKHARDTVLQKWSSTAGLRFENARSELLIGPQARLDFSAVNLLLQQRDNKSMDLQE